MEIPCCKSLWETVSWAQVALLGSESCAQVYTMPDAERQRALAQLSSWRRPAAEGALSSAASAPATALSTSWRHLTTIVLAKRPCYALSTAPHGPHLAAIAQQGGPRTPPCTRALRDDNATARALGDRSANEVQW